LDNLLKNIKIKAIEFLKRILNVSETYKNIPADEALFLSIIQMNRDDPEPFWLVDKVDQKNNGYVVENGRITSLAFNEVGIKVLPELIGNLTDLKELYIRIDGLSSLPESIGNLKSLKILNLYRNNLSYLPESIGNLTLLRTLWLSGNSLSTLPESIVNLKSLTSLYLNANQLVNLPKVVENWIEELKENNCKVIL